MLRDRTGSWMDLLPERLTGLARHGPESIYLVLMQLPEFKTEPRLRWRCQGTWVEEHLSFQLYLCAADMGRIIQGAHDAP